MRPDPSTERVDAEALARHVRAKWDPAVGAAWVRALARERDEQARLAMEYHASYLEMGRERDEALEVLGRLATAYAASCNGDTSDLWDTARTLLARHGKEAAR